MSNHHCIGKRWKLFGLWFFEIEKYIYDTYQFQNLQADVAFSFSSIFEWLKEYFPSFLITISSNILSCGWKELNRKSTLRRWKYIFRIVILVSMHSMKKLFVSFDDFSSFNINWRMNEYLLGFHAFIRG